jgi:hypothetical protein
MIATFSVHNSSVCYHSTVCDCVVEKVCSNKGTIKEVIKSLGLKKAPGLDQITPKMMKELPKKGIVLLTYIFNGIIRMSYWPKQLKISQIIRIAKQERTQLRLLHTAPLVLYQYCPKFPKNLYLEE